MAVEDACLGNILFLLRRHFRKIPTTRHTARPKLSAGDLARLAFLPRGFLASPHTSLPPWLGEQSTVLFDQ